jgi:hypothetical protein
MRRSGTIGCAASGGGDGCVAIGRAASGGGGDCVAIGCAASGAGDGRGAIGRGSSVHSIRSRFKRSLQTTIWGGSIDFFWPAPRAWMSVVNGFEKKREWNWLWVLKQLSQRQFFIDVDVLLVYRDCGYAPAYGIKTTPLSTCFVKRPCRVDICLW